MQLKQLPIWRDANRFLLAIELAVKQFPRYHKYTVGTELRQNALAVCNLIHRAWQEKAALCVHLQSLKVCLDEIKIQLHLAKRLGAIASFATFEHLSQLAVTLAKQNGGWYKARCNIGQNV